MRRLAAAASFDVVRVACEWMLRCVMDEENHETNSDVKYLRHIIVQQAFGKGSALASAADSQRD